MLFLLASSLLAGGQSCPALSQLPLDVSEEVVSSMLDNATAGEERVQCLLLALKKGFFQALSARHWQELRGAKDNAAVQLLREKRSYLRELVERPPPGSLVVVEPVMRWLQDRQTLTLKLRTSHRWDSPPCNRFLTPPTAELTTEGRVVFRAECAMSGERFLFQLDIDPPERVAEVSLHQEGLGMFLLRARKEVPALWNSFRKGRPDEPAEPQGREGGSDGNETTEEEEE